MTKCKIRKAFYIYDTCLLFMKFILEHWDFIRAVLTEVSRFFQSSCLQIYWIYWLASEFQWEIMEVQYIWKAQNGKLWFKDIIQHKNTWSIWKILGCCCPGSLQKPFLDWAWYLRVFIKKLIDLEFAHIDIYKRQKYFLESMLHKFIDREYIPSPSLRKEIYKRN